MPIELPKIYHPHVWLVSEVGQIVIYVFKWLGWWAKTGIHPLRSYCMTSIVGY